MQDLSPNKKHSLTFMADGEVGMGGPMIGAISINGNLLGKNFMGCWLWNENSGSVLLLEFVSRAPDRTKLVSYNAATNVLKHHQMQFGYRLPNLVFSGNLLTFTDTEQVNTLDL
ncbi:hypothetical protein ORJ04_20855 [Rheinheimera baltica]|uniref:Uncharacterized protein n=1 Tax=Rheinheimera baltica TaxID=67576 RepID=A0ABT9I4U5_9GAMM|nr:hypothetical protein [Rheinheimera baltica]MDP5138403.1 hypothetical protein [Rheinheimera baltica]MDP5148846.1 hypothetical protein [Rheinheimera baltica]